MNQAETWQLLVSLLLVALAGLLFSLLLLPSYRGTSILGLLTGGCDLAYCLVFPLTPYACRASVPAPGGGWAVWILWHLLVAQILWKYAKE